MKKVSDFSIQNQILIPTGIIGLILVIVSAINSFAFINLVQSIQDENEITLQKIAKVDEMLLFCQEVESDLYQLFVLESMDMPVENLVPLQLKIKQNLFELKIGLGEYRNSGSLDTSEAEYLDALENPLNAYYNESSQAASLILKDTPLGITYLRSSTENFDLVKDILTDLQAYEHTKLSDQSIRMIQKNQQNITRRFFIMCALIFIGIVVLVRLTHRHFSLPIMEMTGMMKRMGQGDFHQEPLEMDRKDEIGEMALSLQLFQKKLASSEVLDRELAESQRAMTYLLNNIPGFAYRSKGDQPRTMLFLSDGVADIMGCPPGDFLENNRATYSERIHSEDREEVWKTIQMSIAEHANFTIEYRVIGPNGMEKWVWEQGAGVYDQQGELRFLEGYVADVSDRYEAVQEREAAYNNALQQRTAALNLAEDLQQEITERRLLEERLAGKNEELQSLAWKVVNAQELERQALSRELHDDIGQLLTALKIDLSLYRGDMPELNNDKTIQIDGAIALTDTILEGLRRLAHGLRPPSLDTLGLVNTLHRLVENFDSLSETKYTFKSDSCPTPEEIIEITFYRFLQEALTNTLRYSEAEKVRVSYGCQDGYYFLKVEDNGRGFDLDKALDKSIGVGMGIGLSSMKERFEIIQGRFEVESIPGKGTCLAGYAPMKTDP